MSRKVTIIILLLLITLFFPIRVFGGVAKPLPNVKRYVETKVPRSPRPRRKKTKKELELLRKYGKKPDSQVEDIELPEDFEISPTPTAQKTKSSRPSPSPSPSPIATPETEKESGPNLLLIIIAALVGLAVLGYGGFTIMKKMREAQEHDF